MPHLLVDVTSRDTIRRWMQLRMPHPYVGVASPLLISLPLSMFTSIECGAPQLAQSHREAMNGVVRTD